MQEDDTALCVSCGNVFSIDDLVPTDFGTMCADCWAESVESGTIDVDGTILDCEY